MINRHPAIGKLEDVVPATAISLSPAQLPLLQRAQINEALENSLQIPVDVLAKAAGVPPTPFQAVALNTGVRLQAYDHHE